jgi:hypothetical protein
VAFTTKARLARGLSPGQPAHQPAYSRPDEWWEQVAGRPRQLTDWGVNDHFSPETGRILDEWNFEPVLWLARNGQLTGPEVDHLRE